MNRSTLSELTATRDFAYFLCGSWQYGTLLMELLRLFHKHVGCPSAGAFLLVEGNPRQVAKIGERDFTALPGILDAASQAAVKFKYRENTYRPVQLRKKDLFVVTLACLNELYGFVLCEKPKAGGGSDDLISVLAAQASAALKNASLAVEKRIVEDIVTSFASNLDMHIYYPQFATQLRRIAPVDRLTITIPNPFDTKSLIVYGEDIQNPLNTRNTAYKASAPAVVINTGEPLIEEDLRQCRSFVEDDLLLHVGIRCALRVPLISKGLVIGTLNIGCQTPNIYKQKEIELFTEVANRIGHAVENALVYEQIHFKLSQALVQLETSHSATLNALTVILDQRDAGTRGHCQRVVRYAAAIADKLGINGQELEDLRLGSLLHDIGKIGIPDAILFKKGRLNDQEQEIMRTHPHLGVEMLSKVEFLLPARPLVLYHHEWFNGSGYPEGLAGEEIPLAARVFAIADAFDAMTSNRPYRKALTIHAAREEIITCRSIQFCPECVKAFLSIPLEELDNIYIECHAPLDLMDQYAVGQ